jgi:sugar lactone lactonase YvrE
MFIFILKVAYILKNIDRKKCFHFIFNSNSGKCYILNNLADYWRGANLNTGNLERGIYPKKTHSVFSSNTKIKALLLSVLLVLLVLCTINLVCADITPLTFSKFIGGPGNGNGQLQGPVGITLDIKGNFYIADQGNGRVQKFSNDGTYLSQISIVDQNNHVLSPTFVAVDNDGNLYVVCTPDSRVLKYSSIGTYSTDIGYGFGQSDGQYFYPSAIMFGANGNLYIADSYNSRIEVFSTSGTYLKQFGNGQVNNPDGLAQDGSGNIYVSNALGQNIMKFTNEGVYVTQWGGYGSNPGEFKNPGGIAVDKTGNIFVADQNNQRVQMFKIDGTFVASWDQFSMPYCTAVDNVGNAYVTDGYAHWVYQLPLTSFVLPETPWGTTILSIFASLAIFTVFKRYRSKK